MRRPTFATSAIVCLALGVSAAPILLQNARDHIIERRIDAALGSFPGLSHGRISLDAGGGRIAIDHLAFDVRGTKIELGRIALPLPGRAFAAVSSAWAQDNSVSLEDLRIASGKSTILVPHLEASGTALAAEDLKALFDSSRPASAEERLAKLTAKSLSAPEVSILQVNDDTTKAPDRLVFHDVVLTDVVAGKIGKLAVSRAGLDPGGTDKLSTTVQSGPISATQLDLPLALTIAKGSRSDQDMPLGIVYGSFSVSNFKTGDGGSLMTVGSVSSTDARGRPPLRSFAEMVRIADLPADARTEADRQTLADIALDLTKSFTLGSFEIRDSAFKGDQDGPIDAKLDRLGLGGFAVVKLASFGLDGFTLHSKDANVSLAHYGVDGYDQSALVDALLSSLRHAGKLDMHAEVLKMMRPSFDSTSMAALHIDVPSKDGSGNSSDGNRISVDFPTASVTMAVRPDDGSVDTKAHAQMIFSIPPGAASPTLRPAADAGFNDIDLNFDYGLNYSDDNEELKLDQLSLDAKNLIAIKLGGRFDHVSSDLLTAAVDPDATREAMEQVTLEDFSVLLTNAGFIEKILPLLAAPSHVSVPVFKAEMQGQAQAAVIQFMGATPTAERINAAIGEFIAKPKSFKVTIKAPQGLSFGDAAAVDDPKELLGKVDIDAVANR